MSLLLEALKEKDRTAPSEVSTANHLLAATQPQPSRRSLLLLSLLLFVVAGGWAAIHYAPQWLPLDHLLQWLPLARAPQRAPQEVALQDTPLPSPEANAHPPAAEPPQPVSVALPAVTPLSPEQLAPSAQQGSPPSDSAAAPTPLPTPENSPESPSVPPSHQPGLAKEPSMPPTNPASHAQPTPPSPSTSTPSQKGKPVQNPSSHPVAAEQGRQAQSRAASSDVPSVTENRAPSKSTSASAKERHPAQQNGSPSHEKVAASRQEQRAPQKTTPGSRHVTLAEAYQLAQQGRWTEAASAYQALLLVAPDHPDVLLGNALVSVQLGHPSEALAYLRRLLTHAAPGHPHALAQLAILTNGLDPLADESALRLAVASHPNRPELYHALGRVLAAQNRWSEAQQAFFHAMTLAPSDATIRYDLAVSLDQLGQYAAALEHYRHAERLASQTPNPPFPLAQVRQRIQLLHTHTRATLHD